MSDDTTTPGTTSGDAPPHRYTAALAQDIEQRWQDLWADEGTVETPNPTGLLADPDGFEGRGEK